MSNDNDILVELSNSEIEEYRKFYKNFPNREFLFVHLYLKNQLRWNQLMMQTKDKGKVSDRCKMKFYRSSKEKNGNYTLIGITGEKEYSIFIASLDESLKELQECLVNTKQIKWDKLPLFVAVHRRFNKMLYDIFEIKNVRVRVDNCCSTLFMEKENALNYEIIVPDDVELKMLDVDDYELINDLWPYKYPGSECFIKSLIELNGGLGIYKNQKLVSWILQVESFGLGLLQTMDEHQGKGYARLLTRALTRKISEEYGEDIILFASYSKPKTVDLYIRYDYKHISYTHWMYLKAH